MGLSSSALNAGLAGAVIGCLSWVLQTAREGANLAREVTAVCSDFARVTKTFSRRRRLFSVDLLLCWYLCWQHS